MFSFDEIRKVDPKLAEAMDEEMMRQKTHIELIASENIVSPAVMAAMGSHLTNKYAEGYPGHRYYGGCEFVDIVEVLARERLKKLFGAEYVNVQPHSGAQANMAAFFAVLKPGDIIMGMALDSGGHLTHGSPVNLSGKYFNMIPYGVDENGYIDYDSVEMIAKAVRPKMIVCGASAYARKIDFKRFRQIADSVGAVLMADIAHIAGLVATGYHESPVGVADIVTSTTHKTLRGPRGGVIMATAEANEKYNFDKAIFPGTQGGPLEHVIAAKAVCFHEDLQPEYKEYIGQVVKNASVLADALLDRGFNLVSGGTDNHLMLIDLRPKGITGKEAEDLFWRANITANKNAIPNDPEKATVTSGLRVGTPAITSRGMVEEDMEVIADALNIMADKKEDGIEEARALVKGLTDKYPIYPMYE